MTATPGSTAFCASTMRPLSSPVPCWADANPMKRNDALTVTATIDWHRCMDPLRKNGFRGDLTDHLRNCHELFSFFLERSAPCRGDRSSFPDRGEPDPPRCSGESGGGFLEQNFGGELDLPRRAGVAGREARIANHAERRAADCRDAARLAEVRLVEQVEDLEAELHARRAGHLHVLDDRQVGVAESRADDGVPREISEMRHTIRRVREREDRRRGAGARD